jgi:hypothetical protein
MTDLLNVSYLWRSWQPAARAEALPPLQETRAPDQRSGPGIPVPGVFVRSG